MVLSATCLLGPIAPAHSKLGDPGISVKVSSGSQGPSDRVVVRGTRLSRVAFDFRTLVRWWGGRQLVFHATPGNSDFGVHYYVCRGGEWDPVTSRIVSERGFVYGRVTTLADVKMRLVVRVGRPHPYAEILKKRFRLTAGTPGFRTRYADAVVWAGLATGGYSTVSSRPITLPSGSSNSANRPIPSMG